MQLGTKTLCIFERNVAEGKSMTIIIALKCKDGTVIASDGRIVRGDEFRSEQKIFKISEKVIVGLAGSTGVIKRIVRALLPLNISGLKSDEEIEISTIIIETYIRIISIPNWNLMSNSMELS